MKKILLFLSVAIFMMACNAGGNSPKATVDAMFTAMKAGNLDDMKKYITKSDVALLEIPEKAIIAFDPDAAKKMREKIIAEFKDKIKDVIYVLKDEKIAGDSATLTAEFTQNGKTESQNIDLLKEDGVWKVSFTKSKFSSSDKAKMEEALKNLNPDSIKNKLKEGLEEMKNMNSDSFRQEMNKVLDNSGMSDSMIRKLKEAAEKARQGH